MHHYNWHRSHESLHGDTPVDRVCQRADKTPLWAAVCEAYDPAKERIQVRHHAVEIALRALKKCLWTAQIKNAACCESWPGQNQGPQLFELPPGSARADAPGWSRRQTSHACRLIAHSVCRSMPLPRAENPQVQWRSRTAGAPPRNPWCSQPTSTAPQLYDLAAWISIALLISCAHPSAQAHTESQLFRFWESPQGVANFPPVGIRPCCLPSNLFGEDPPSRPSCRRRGVALSDFKSDQTQIAATLQHEAIATRVPSHSSSPCRDFPRGRMRGLADRPRARQARSVGSLFYQDEVGLRCCDQGVSAIDQPLSSGTSQRTGPVPAVAAFAEMPARHQPSDSPCASGAATVAAARV